MVATSSGTALIDGQVWIACTRSASLGCNWLVPEEQEFGAYIPPPVVRKLAFVHKVIRETALKPAVPQ